MPWDPAHLSLPINAVVFTVAAVVVWIAGSRLAVYAAGIADRTGIGRAFAGVVLLGVTTSLAEVATTVTASAAGDALLAGNNLVGGIAMQVAVLAVIDLVAFRRGALTRFTPQPVLLMEGVLLIGLLALAIAAIAAGELISLGGVGLWPVILAAAYLGALLIIRRYDQQPEWEATERSTPSEAETDTGTLTEATDATESRSLAQLGWLFAAAALAVLMGGFVVAQTGGAIAEQTGLGSSFVGATLVAISTSLPEVSTTYKAVRLGAFGMAVSNILGTNAVSVALLLLADVAYRGGPIFNVLDHSTLFLAAIGVLTTAIYLWGLLERRDRTFLGMGVDSAAVLVCYGASLVVLYFIR